jgi:hypothetical protein
MRFRKILFSPQRGGIIGLVASDDGKVWVKVFRHRFVVAAGASGRVALQHRAQDGVKNSLGLPVALNSPLPKWRLVTTEPAADSSALVVETLADSFTPLLAAYRRQELAGMARASQAPTPGVSVTMASAKLWLSKAGHRPLRLDV